MADTTTMTMDGTWMAAAGEGYVTVTPIHGYGSIRWATATPATAGNLTEGHFIKEWADRAFQIGAGDQLYLTGASGYVVVITRETDPA